MKKTEKILIILRMVLENSASRIPVEDILELVGSRATYYRLVKELTDDMISGNASLFRLVKDEGQEYLCLNKSMFKHFHPEHLETSYIFEAYARMGALLKTDNFNEDVEFLKESVFKLNGHAEQMKRKFHYLDQVTRKKTSKDIDLKSKIVNSLVLNNFLDIQYSGKIYSSVAPLCLVQYRDALYLVLAKNLDHLDRNIRRFKLDRIESIEVLEESFVYPKSTHWCPNRFFAESSGMMTGDIQTAKLRVFGDSRIHIREKSFFFKEHLFSTEHHDEYQIKFSNIDEVLGQLFVYAQDIQILENDQLSDGFINKAKLAIRKNSV